MPLLTPAERTRSPSTALLARHRLEEQYAQPRAAARDRGARDVGLPGHRSDVLRRLVPRPGRLPATSTRQAFERASAKLNWLIGGINTVVLLVSSLFMVLAVHFAKLGHRKRVRCCLGSRRSWASFSWASRPLEYYIDYRENLIPGWRFDDQEWVAKDGLRPERGAAREAVSALLLDHDRTTRRPRDDRHRLRAGHAGAGGAGLSRRTIIRRVDVTALYWHFVDTVWIFLLPMLYLLGTHTWADMHILLEGRSWRRNAPSAHGDNLTSSSCTLLIVFTVLTVGGLVHPACRAWWHVVIGLAIAAVKGSLVVVFFMHALISSRVTWIVIAVACFWLVLLLVLGMTDYASRDLIPFMPGH